MTLVQLTINFFEIKQLTNSNEFWRVSTWKKEKTKSNSWV